MSQRFEVREGGLQTNSVHLQPIQSGTFDLHDLAVAIAGTGVASVAIVEAILTAMMPFIIQALLRGERVNIGEIVSLHVTLGGKFADVNSVRTQDINVDVKADVGKAIVDAVKSQITLEQVPTTNLNPQINSLTAVSGNLSALNSGAVLQMTGFRLMFDPAQADNGIFFTSAAGDEVKVTTVITRQAKKLVFVVPDGLTPGQVYNIVVRARSKGAKPTAPLYQGTAPVTVTAA